MCLLYHWTDEYVLNMPARRFFSLLKSGREIKRKQELRNLIELTDIAAIPLYVADYHKELRQYYVELANPEIKKKREMGRVLDAASKESGELVASIFRAKQKVEGRG